MPEYGRTVTLLSDFGCRDGFVGIMKGVIASIAPQARLIDLCHAVAPQDIVGAGFQLAAGWPFFPKGTVHVVVVDPGVGTDRAVLAIQAADHCFLVPDNGVITSVLPDPAMADSIIRVENPTYFLKPVSPTFHGRDIFAPVAAHIVNGVPLDALGPAVQDYMTTGFPGFAKRRLSDGGWLLTGEVVHVDHFGNLVTNIPLDPGASVTRITLGDKELPGLQKTFADGAPGALIAYVGSSGYLEVAINRGRAAELPGLNRGKKVYVRTGSDPK